MSTPAAKSTMRVARRSARAGVGDAEIAERVGVRAAGEEVAAGRRRSAHRRRCRRTSCRTHRRRQACRCRRARSGRRPGKAGQHVGCVGAGEQVDKVRADRFSMRNSVSMPPPPVACSVASERLDADAGRREGIVDRVGSGAAVHLVVAVDRRSACRCLRRRQVIVTCAAGQRVVAGAAGSSRRRRRGPFSNRGRRRR